MLEVHTFNNPVTLELRRRWALLKERSRCYCEELGDCGGDLQCCHTKSKDFEVKSYLFATRDVKESADRAADFRQELMKCGLMCQRHHHMFDHSQLSGISKSDFRQHYRQQFVKLCDYYDKNNTY